jgi:Na+/H+ antiporter NhaD/arsenite permease-like protein
MKKLLNLKFLFIAMATLVPLFAFSQHSAGEAPSIGGIRIEFILFGLTLLGVALFHHHTLKVALTGLTVILLFKFIFADGFNLFHHIFGKVDGFFNGENPFIKQIIDKEARQGEWPILLNLFGLLIGFAVLAKHFEESGVPDILPKYLPDDWKGPFVLLFFVFILSTFLDNIAAAMIGGTVALVIFKNKVHIGYIAAIVAASNAGGAGSVVGDTTTTMMWIDGVSALNVLHAFVASFVAFLIFAFYASFQQDKKQRIQKDVKPGVKIDIARLLIVAMILAMTILTNILFDFPALGVWIAILIGAIFRKTPWKEAKEALGGSVFLLSLVTCASMMPVEELPDASWQTSLSLGFISAVFDNIPLTKLALDQGHYDWGMLAYAVGFGGSMVWFGSSAGVAITNKFHEARNVGLWIRKGWHVMIAYVIGFFALYLLMGWEPADNKQHTEPPINCKADKCKARDDAQAKLLFEQEKMKSQINPTN